MRGTASLIAIGCSCLLLAACSRKEHEGQRPPTAIAALNANPKLSDFVVEAQNSVRLQTGSVVTGGDVGARGTGSGPFLSSNFVVDVLTGTTVSGNLIADSVRLGNGAKVGDVQTNRFVKGTGTTHGSISALVPLPALAMPAPVSAGSANLSVATGATRSITPASFATVTVGTGGKLRLSSGAYDMVDLVIGNGGRIEALGPVQLRISNRLSGGTGVFIGAAAGVSSRARDIRIEVSGKNGTTGALTATPIAASFTTGARLTALMLVPNGTLALGTGAVVTGAFLARDVDVGTGATLTFQDGFTDGTCTAATCDDHDPCTVDSCAAGGVCSHAPAPAGTSCADSDPCNGDETCQSGACVRGPPVVCAAIDDCHVAGMCDPTTGRCPTPPKDEGSPCSDGNGCTAGDACHLGTCTGGAPTVCVPLDQCHVAGVCNPGTGICSDPIATNGTACSDGNGCTKPDVCMVGACVPGGPVVCAAQDQCHGPGTCDPATGACSNPPLPGQIACDDSNACTTGEVCLAGSCQGGQPVPVDDGNVCTTDACSPQTGPTHTPVAADTPCPGGLCLGSPIACTPLAIHIDSPASLLTVGAFPIQVKGSVNAASAVVTVNGIAVNNVNGKFTASVALEEGHNVVVARAVAGGRESTDSISVSLDRTPPYVTVEYPADGQTLYADKVTVTGLINDIVRGTIEQAQAAVTVNNVSATISNRSYSAKDVPLVPGDNLLTVVGTDQVGNVGTAKINVTYVVPTGRRLQIVSGQDQAAAIGAVLGTPLGVRVVDDAQAPVPNTPVVFRVTQGSGIVGAGTADEARAVVVTTDSQGIARTKFKLGMRSGSANQKVRAKVVGYDDEAIFYASAVSKPGNKINVNSGNNQRSSFGQPLPEALVVVVTDEGANVVQGASVRFDVNVGGGKLSNGTATYETQTDSDGRATAEYTPGPLGGIDAQRVTATLLSATGSDVITAGFSATAFVPGDPGLTTISGVVLDNQDVPLAGVTIRAVGTTRQAVTNDHGQFRITQAPVGPVNLLADGSTTTAAGEYPSLSYNVVTVAGVDNPLPAPIYMVKLDTEHAVMVGAEDVAIELPGYPGFKLEIKKGSATFPDGSKEGLIAITSVNASAVPMAPPNGMQPQFIVAIQPTNTRFDPPARLTLPNIDGFPPGAQADMYSFDHDLEEFVPIGLGTVSEDGTVLQSNIGVGVIKAGWHCGSQPSGQGCTHNCPICQDCDPSCVCQNVPTDPALTHCQKCDNGSAVADVSKDGNSCDLSSGVHGVCSGGNCVAVDITELWSNQIGGVKANYLPNGTGTPARDFILMGARADYGIYLRVLMRVTNDPLARPRLAVVRDVDGAKMVEQPAASVIDLSFLPAPNSIDTYHVVAGNDTNGNGLLDSTEITTGNKWKVTAVSKDRTEASTLMFDTLLAGATLLPWADWPIGEAFLRAFLFDGAQNIPTKIAASNGTTTMDSVAVNELEHNIGAIFDNSGTGPVVHNYFSPPGYVSTAVLVSEDLFDAAKRTMQLNRPAFEQAMVNAGLQVGDKMTFPPVRLVTTHANPNALIFQFLYSPSPFALYPNDQDLGLAFVTAAIDAQLVFEIKRHDADTYRVIRADVVDGPNGPARIWDTYDLGFEDAGLVDIQAGYNGDLLQAGHVFKTTVYLAGQVPALSGCDITGTLCTYHK